MNALKFRIEGIGFYESTTDTDYTILKMEDKSYITMYQEIEISHNHYLANAKQEAEIHNLIGVAEMVKGTAQQLPFKYHLISLIGTVAKEQLDTVFKVLEN